MTSTVTDLVVMLDHDFPMAWAEPWDRVGLRVGDGRASVHGVFVTLDPTEEAVEKTAAAGANVLLTHHPPFLEALDEVTGSSTAGRVVLSAARRGVAIVAMHTNLDRAPAGGDALAEGLGLSVLRPLERSLQEVDIVTVYVPVEAEAAVRQEMIAAGAGRIGQYEGCAFVGQGSGGFSALEGASPRVGEADGAEVAEKRVEMIAPTGRGLAVADAARAVHPYEEPVITVARGGLSRGVARLGRLCSTTPTSLAGLASAVSERLSTPVRVWGDEGTRVRTVAVANGSGTSLIGAAREAGADALVTGEVRYHDALEALGSGLAIVEAGHDATEWPLVRVLARAARRAVGDGAVIEDEVHLAWWSRGKGE